MKPGIRALHGAELEGSLDVVARLRIDVFRDWPYLYDGDLYYERRYLRSYIDSADAVLVGAFDGDRLVGAATGTPMEDHAAELGKPLTAAGYALTDVFYCAESVLLAPYRGQGLGHAFFDLRESHARRLGRRWSAFCAVIRPENHSARPADYRPLDAFWRKRGYAPLAGVTAEFSWRDLGDETETAKQMQFWIREL